MTNFSRKSLKYLLFEKARLRTVYDRHPNLRDKVVKRYKEVIEELLKRKNNPVWNSHVLDDLIIKKGPGVFIKPNKPAWRIFEPEEVFKIKQFSLPTLVDLKIDGMRTQIHITDKVSIFSEDEGLRKETKFKRACKDIKEHIPSGTILDAEGVIVEGGQVLHRTTFIGYVNGKEYKEEEDERAEFWVFDVLYWKGEDLRDKPLSERLDYLKKVPISKHLKPMKISKKAFVCKTKDGVLKAIDRVREMKGAEGAMIKFMDGKYIKEVHNKSWCLTGSSRIITDKGLRFIRDVKSGWKVLSQDGLFHKVLAVSKRSLEPNEVLYEFRPYRGIRVRITGDHEIKTKSGWKRFSKIKKTTELEEVKVNLTKFILPKEIILKLHGYKKIIKVNEDFLRYLGLWIAEGYSSSRGLYHGLAFQGAFKYKTKFDKVFSQKSYRYDYGLERLDYYDPPMTKWLIKNCRDEMGRKIAPLWLANLNERLFNSFWNGYLEGDGTKNQPHDTWGTSSSSLASSLYLIMKARGRLFRWKYRKPRRGKGTFVLTEVEKRIKGEHKIKRLWLGKKKINVYDIEVEGEESFIIPEAILHNCKLKNLKEVDVIVTAIETPKHKKGPLKGKPIAGVYNYHIAAGPYSEECAEKVKEKKPKAIREIKGKAYSFIGKTFNTSIKVKVGDIIRIYTPEVNKYQIEGTDCYTFGVFEPKVLEHVSERSIPDTLNVLMRLSKETPPREVKKKLEVEPLSSSEYKWKNSGKEKSFKFVLQRHYPTGKKERIKPSKKIPTMHKIDSDVFIEAYRSAQLGCKPCSWFFNKYFIKNKELLKRIILKMRDHIDLRMEVNGSLIGVTIHPPIEKGKNSWDVFKGRLKEDTRTQCTPKYEHPKGWLTEEGVLRFPTRHTKPPEKEQEAHFIEVARMDIIDKGIVKYGVQRKTLHEYFFYGKYLKGRWVLRRLKIGKEFKHEAWLLMKPSNQTPLDPKEHRDSGYYKIDWIKVPSTEERRAIEQEVHRARLEEKIEKG